MLVYQDVMDDLGIQRAAVYCNTSPEFRDLTNQAQRRLMRRGDWIGSAVPIYVCVYNGCVVWPRYVQAVRKIMFCNHHVPVENLWYRFMEGICDRGGMAWWGNTMWGPWGVPQGFLQQSGKTSVFQDIQGDGRLVRAYARCPQDLGSTVTIFGTDNNGQPLHTNNGDGTYSNGVKLVLQKPFASTPMFVRSIDYVLKDPTQCIVDLYAYNAATDLLEDLAHYDPTETRPDYERNRLSIPTPPCGLGGVAPPSSGKRGVVALVKLKYFPAQFPTDLIFIDNLDALQFEIRSIKAGDAGKIAEKQEWEVAAIEALNRDIENQSPDTQFASINNVFGGRDFSNHCF